MSYTGNQISEALDKMNIEGDVVCPQFYEHIKHPSGKPNFLAILMLANFMYWYRPTKIRDQLTNKVIGLRKKFKGDLLQRDYGQIEKQFDVSYEQVKTAFECLERADIAHRVFRTIKLNNGRKLSNVLFISLNISKIRDIVDFKEILPCEDISSHPKEYILGPCEDISSDIPIDYNTNIYTLSKERACETDQEKDQEPSNSPPKERLEKDDFFKFGDISNPKLSKEDGLPILNLSQVEKDCLVKIGLGLSISVEEARDIAEHVIIEYRAKCGENNTIHKKPYSILAKWMSHSVAKLKEKKAKQNQEKANEPSKAKRESAAKQPEKPRELKDESKKLLDELFELEKRSSRRKTLNEPTNE